MTIAGVTHDGLNVLTRPSKGLLFGAQARQTRRRRKHRENYAPRQLVGEAGASVGPALTWTDAERAAAYDALHAMFRDAEAAIAPISRRLAAARSPV